MTPYDFSDMQLFHAKLEQPDPERAGDKFPPRYYGVLAQFEYDLAHHRYGRVAGEAEAETLKHLIALMREMENRDATLAEYMWAAHEFGTWTDDSYWRMYGRNIETYWRDALPGGRFAQEGTP